MLEEEINSVQISKVEEEKRKSDKYSLKSKEFFFEIFTEEIPARMQFQSIEAAKSAILQALNFCKIEHGSVEVLCSARHLAVCVYDVAVCSSALIEEKRGPRITAPQQALDGFLTQNAVSSDKVFKKDGYWFFKKETLGELFEVKIPVVLEIFIKNMHWPNTMRWFCEKTQSLSASWVRPVRSMVCTYGGEYINFLCDSFGINTSNCTFGERFLAPEKLIFSNCEQYKKVLRDSFVIVDYKERQDFILNSIKECLSFQQMRGTDIRLNEDYALLREVTGLVEYPFVVLGKIEESFMNLPSEVLQTSMRVHQKYFTTSDSQGKLAPFFVAISNKPPREGDVIKQGFEKVLRARLHDALFFYNEDISTDFELRYDKLTDIVFHAKLGSVYNRVERISKIVAPFVEKAARLCKLDLTTNMVGEFAELQGVMGKHYALKQGESADVAEAIFEHYLPKGQDDKLPSTEMGVELAVADRVDLLVGFIGVNILPTGSKDPFALRRAALGLIRILCEHKEIDLLEKLYKSIAAYEAQGICLKSDTLDTFKEFLKERLAFYLKDHLNIRYDIVKSVMSFYEFHESIFNIFELVNKAYALQNYFETNSSKTSLMKLYNRLNGLLGGANYFSRMKNFTQNNGSEIYGIQKVNKKLLEAEEELDAYKSLADSVERVLTCVKLAEYSQALNNIANLADIWEIFFNKVKINVEKKEIRENRQYLISMCMFLYDQISDFSEIVDL